MDNVPVLEDEDNFEIQPMHSFQQSRSPMRSEGRDP